MDKKKDKSSNKPENLKPETGTFQPDLKKKKNKSKNWKTSLGIKIVAMLLAVVSGFFVVVTGVITVEFGVDSDFSGSQKQVEEKLDTQLLRSYAYWMGDAVVSRSKKQDEADALKQFDDGNIVYSLVKRKAKGKETELVCGNYTGTALNKENALAWLKFSDTDVFYTYDTSFWEMLLEKNGSIYSEENMLGSEVDHYIYDDGVIYCYADNILFRINSFSFSEVPEEQNDLEVGMEYSYRESEKQNGYYDEYGNKLKKSSLEPYLKSTDLKFWFDDEVEACYLWSKSDGIYPIRQESIADTYPNAKVFQWQDFTLTYTESNQEYISYDAQQEKDVAEYTIYLTVADPLKGNKVSVSSLFSQETGDQIVLTSGMTQFFQKAHTLSGLVVQVRKTSGWWLLLSVLIWLVSLGILFVSAGWKKGVDTIQIRWIDRIPFGIYSVISGFLFIGCGMVCLYMGNLLMQNTGTVFCVYFGAIAFALAELIVYEYVISNIVRIRAKKFWQYTLLYMLLKPLRKAKKKLHGIWDMVSANLSMIVKATVVFLLIFFIEAFLLLVSGADGGIMILYIIWKIVEYWILLKLLAQFRMIFDGGARVARGDYTHPIDSHKMIFEFHQHAENLNNVQAGVAAAVEEKMKSERFRTELITNVSHDIKTPLTSIINYVDLIKKEPMESETMQEYVKVLDRQSTRLKKLIEDLMEASKASTGNLPVNAEVCDATVMLTQIVGEFSERAQKNQLELVVDCPNPPVLIFVDGRHLWRIIDNLMSNICKYAQSGTRVYISLEKYHGMVIMTFRNISRDRLKMSSEELFGRFVRGDSSRNTEGNGLGLSIAKSLTELMHGNLAVQIDGDLFKVILSFDEYQTKE